MSIFHHIDPQAYKNFKGELCPASVYGSGLDLRYLVCVDGAEVTYRVKSHNRTIHKGTCSVKAAEAYNRVLSKASAAEAKSKKKAAK